MGLWVPPLGDAGGGERLSVGDGDTSIASNATDECPVATAGNERGLRLSGSFKVLINSGGKPSFSNDCTSTLLHLGRQTAIRYKAGANSRVPV